MTTKVLSSVLRRSSLLVLTLAGALAGCADDGTEHLTAAEQGLEVAMSVASLSSVEPGDFVSFNVTLSVGDDAAYNAVLTFSMDDLNGLNTPTVDDGSATDAEADYGLGVKPFQPTTYFSALNAGPAATTPLGLSEGATTGTLTWNLGTIPDGWAGATTVTIRVPQGTTRGSQISSRFKLTYATTPGGATTSYTANNSATPTTVLPTSIYSYGTQYYGNRAPGSTNVNFPVRLAYELYRDVTDHEATVTSTGTCTPLFRSASISNPWSGSAEGTILQMPTVGAPMTPLRYRLDRSSRWQNGGLSSGYINIQFDIPSSCAIGSTVELSSAETLFTGTADETTSNDQTYISVAADPPAATCQVYWQRYFHKSTNGLIPVPGFFGPSSYNVDSTREGEITVERHMSYPSGSTVAFSRLYQLEVVPAGQAFHGLAQQDYISQLYKDCDNSGLLPSDPAFTTPTGSGWSPLVSTAGVELVPGAESNPGAEAPAGCRILTENLNVPANVSTPFSALYRACTAGEACFAPAGTNTTVNMRVFRTYNDGDIDTLDTIECGLAQGAQTGPRRGLESYPSFLNTSLSPIQQVYSIGIAAGSAGQLNFSIQNQASASQHIIGNYAVNLYSSRNVLNLDAVTGGFESNSNVLPNQNISGQSCNQAARTFVPPSAAGCNAPNDLGCLARWELPQACQPFNGSNSPRMLLTLPVKRGVAEGTTISVNPALYKSDYSSLGADNRVPSNEYGLGDSGQSVSVTVLPAAAVALTQIAPQQWPEGSIYLDSLAATNQGNVRLNGLHIVTQLPRAGVLGTTATPAYDRVYATIPATTGTGVVESTTSATCLTDSPGAPWTSLGGMVTSSNPGFALQSSALIPPDTRCVRFRLAPGSAGLAVASTLNLAVGIDTTGLVDDTKLVARSTVGVSSLLLGSLDLPATAAQDVTTTVSNLGAATVTKVAEPDSTRPGFSKWTIRYANKSGRVLTALELTDVLPANATFAGLATALTSGQSCLVIDAGNCATEDVGMGPQLRFGINSVAADDGINGSGPDEGTIVIWTSTNTGVMSGMDITNCAEITASTPPLSNDSSGCGTTQLSRLTLTKSVVGGITQSTVGAALEYRLLATNTSTTSSTFATVVDTLPANTAFLPGSLRVNGLAASDLYVSGGVLRYEHPTPLLPGTTITLNFRVVSVTVPPGGMQTNTATAYSCVNPTQIATCTLAIGSNTVSTSVGVDTDGDGVTDADDSAPNDPMRCRDSDGDTCDDCSITGANHSGGSVINDGPDNDFDGACDAGDADDDNDGVCDGPSASGACIAGPDPSPNNSSQCGDRDADTCDDCSQGTVNVLNDGYDADNDGLCSIGEITAGTNPADRDTDEDGVLDAAEPFWSTDSDGDGLVNARDVDSDNDGIYDGTEMGIASANTSYTNISLGYFVADADPSTTTNPLNPDSDNGGVRDGAEDPNHNGRIDAGELNPNLGSDDVAPDDDDSDGLTNAEETYLGSDPQDADSDDDGVVDGDEANFSVDLDGDGLPNAIDPDSDGDGLFDGTELGITVPATDTDIAAGNFVADADNSTTTNPNLADTDGGGRNDGLEDFNLDGAFDSGEFDPLDPSDDDVTLDLDGDGISDVFEGAGDLDGDGQPNYLDLDADGDGILDETEAGQATPGIRPVDTDGDGTPDFLDVDSDGDFILDAQEAGDADLATAPVDTDGDGTPDYLDTDSDGDGVSDILEAGDRDLTTPAVDSDGDGTEDFRSADSDGDLVADGVDNCRTVDNPLQADADADGIGDVCDPLLDVDMDGIDDAIDVCPGAFDPAQFDTDGDGIGNICDDDDDGDNVPDDIDNCIGVANPDQIDIDNDGRGDACDGSIADQDEDGVPDDIDVCPRTADPDQADADNDGIGDECDADRDGDGIPDDYAVSGSANCQTGGGSSGILVVLAMFGAVLGLGRRRRRTQATTMSIGVGAIALLAVAAPAQAQSALEGNRNFSVERFHWTASSEGMVGVNSGEVPPTGSLDVGVMFGASGDSLVLINTSDNVQVGALVGQRISGSIVAAYSLLSRLQLGLEIPLILAQSGDTSLPGVATSISQIGSTGMGDIRVAPKLALLADGGIDLALIVAVTVPTAQAEDYRGEDGLSVAPEIAVSGRAGPLRVGFNGGYLARKNTTLVDLTIGDEVFARVGAGFQLAPNPIEVQGSIAVATAAATPFQQRSLDSIEFLLGADVDLPGPWALAVLGGIGLREGFGTPDWRAVVGMRFAAGHRRDPPASPDDDSFGDDVLAAR